MRARIAVCDDEMLIRLWLQEHLQEAGFAVVTFERAGDLLAALEPDPVDLILLDLRLPDGSGLDFLADIKAHDAQLPVIMMTAYGEVETAVRAVREGAYHFLEKPIELPELILLIERALETTHLMTEVSRLREGTSWQFSDVKIVGRSHAMNRMAETVTRLGVRGQPASVLIQGETGTGKDLVARAIHARGPRHDKPFISLNCTALPDTLAESELFGHQAGAFTDAREEKRGLFELAHRGTLFLDEVGDMSLSAQSKLLSVLETHTIRRVGGVKDIPVDVHIVAATNRDLEASVADGAFREDLFYRLSVVPITVPPLRERREDIAPLALHFVAALCSDMAIPERLIEPEALRAIEAHDWPGNARQLRNLLERILLLEDLDTIRVESLPPEVRGEPADSGANPRPFTLPLGGIDLEAVERDLIEQALEQTGGNKTRAAQLLGLSRDTFRYRVEKHGL
jgi:two-component system, NtrC family, response regulator AtoC